MKIIITEEQQISLKHKLQKMVKKLGWEKTSIVVNGPKNLAKLAFNNDPLEFLNTFNNLDVVQSEERPDWRLFRCEKGNNMMIYDRKREYVYVSYDVIWSFLEDGFGLEYKEIQGITKEWLGETYNLRGITTHYSLIAHFGKLGETYNLRGITTPGSFREQSRVLGETYNLRGITTHLFRF